MRKQKITPTTIALLGTALVIVTVLNVLLSWQWQHRHDHPDNHHLVSTTSNDQGRSFLGNAPPESSGMVPIGNTLSYSLSPLAKLTDSPRFRKCPDGLQLRRDRGYPSSKNARQKEFSKIPRIVHQTAKSRCLANDIYKLTEKWQFEDWEYYFHDDQAIERLFAQEAIHFPLLPLIAKHCLRHGTLKADLWRYLVLWVYGGIYTDLDTAPNAFSPQTTISAADDGLFVVEQYHMLSQYFMAVTPRHPLMWYAIQRALQNLWDLPDTGKVSAAMTTGPHVLHAAFMDFRRDAGHAVDPAGVGYKPVWAGRFIGTWNTTVTVIGVGEHQNEYVHRDLLGIPKKAAAYKEMHMRHFQQDKKFPTGRSCLSTILQDSHH